MGTFVSHDAAHHLRYARSIFGILQYLFPCRSIGYDAAVFVAMPQYFIFVIPQYLQPCRSICCHSAVFVAMSQYFIFVIPQYLFVIPQRSARNLLF